MNVQNLRMNTEKENVGDIEIVEREKLASQVELHSEEGRCNRALGQAHDTMGANTQTHGLVHVTEDTQVLRVQYLGRGIVKNLTFVRPHQHLSVHARKN